MIEAGMMCNYSWPVKNCKHLSY